jgi:membrane protein DedA with SNARE-associated domain
VPVGSVDDLLVSYPVLFLGCALSGLGFPLPEDVVLLWAGMQVAEGGFVWERVLPIALAGILVRDVLAYLIGRVLGDRLLTSRLAARVLPVAKIARVRGLVARRSALAVLLGRLAIGFRVPVFVAAGISGVGAPTFLAVDALAMVVTVPAEVVLGARYGRRALDVGARVLGTSSAFWAALTIVLVLLLARRRRKDAA